MSVDQSVLETKQLLNALISVRGGDFSARLPEDWLGINGKIADVFNDVVEMNQRMARELERLSRVVGKEGKIKQRVSLGGADGAWTDMVNSINTLVDDLVQPTTEMARV